MRVLEHRLIDGDGQPVAFQKSPNQTRGRTIEPSVLVMHYTAGASATSSIAWLCDKQARASAHLVIGRDGSITQLVEFNRKAWHAGVSRWNEREGVNNFSIGIEMANAGVLQGGPGRWRTSFEARIGSEDVLIAPHKVDGVERSWERYTGEQLEVAAVVAAALSQQYGLVEVLGHEDVAPGRKLDPGPAFPMASFKALAEGRKQDRPVLYRTAVALNIRSGAGSDFEKLEASPLPRGTRLDVLASHGVWRQVDVLDTVDGDMDLNGWVHGRYIRRA